MNAGLSTYWRGPAAPAFYRLDVSALFNGASGTSNMRWHEERRALWQSQLGASLLTHRKLNELAATADLCGGYIRNVILTVAVLECEAQAPIECAGVLLRRLAREYRRLGRQLPWRPGAET